MAKKTYVRFSYDGSPETTDRRSLGYSAGVVTGELYIQLFGTRDQLRLYRRLRSVKSRKVRWVHNDGDAITLMKEPEDGDTRSLAWYTANIANGAIKELFIEWLNDEELKLLNEYLRDGEV